MENLVRIYETLPRAVKRFLVTGTLTVGVDALTYALLLRWDIAVDAAKALSLVAATIFAYLVNRFWTFNDSSARGQRVVPFLLVYASAIVLNVGVNHVFLWMLGTRGLGYAVSWFAATASSSSWNYFGLRYVVFPSERGGRAELASQSLGAAPRKTAE